jgi:hypothetical protein
LVVAACQVGFDALGWLVGELDAVLQHWHWEDWGRHAGQP